MKGGRIFAVAVAAAFVAAMASPGIARSATIVQTFSYNFGDDRREVTVAANGPTHFIFVDPPRISRTFDFDKFNPALGTLEAINFTINHAGTLLSGLIHNGGGSGTINSSFTVWFRFELGGGALAQGETKRGSQIQTAPWLLWEDGLNYKGASQNLDVNPDLNQNIDYEESRFAEFTGDGTLDFEVFFGNSVEILSVTGDAGLTATFFVGSCTQPCGNFGNSILPMHGTATLTYVYSPAAIPVLEPGSLALFGAGLAGVAFARRRRSA